MGNDLDRTRKQNNDICELHALFIPDTAPEPVLSQASPALGRMKSQDSLSPSTTEQDTNGNDTIASPQDLATNTVAVPLASYIDPNTISEGDRASWTGKTSIPVSPRARSKLSDIAI